MVERRGKELNRQSPWQIGCRFRQRLAARGPGRSHLLSLHHTRGPGHTLPMLSSSSATLKLNSISFLHLQLYSLPTMQILGHLCQVQVMLKTHHRNKEIKRKLKSIAFSKKKKKHSLHIGNDFKTISSQHSTLLLESSQALLKGQENTIKVV